MSDPNVPPFLYGLVIVGVLVTYAYGGLLALAVVAALADIALHRIEHARARRAARATAESAREQVTGRTARDR